MIYAFVKNSKVENLVIIDNETPQSFIDSASQNYDFVVNITDYPKAYRPRHGWGYDGTVFTPIEDTLRQPKDDILDKLKEAKQDFDTLTENQKDRALLNVIKAVIKLSRG